MPLSMIPLTRCDAMPRCADILLLPLLYQFDDAGKIWTEPLFQNGCVCLG